MSKRLTNGDKLSKEELLEVLDSSCEIARQYWRRGQYGLGVSDSINAKWERKIQMINQAYAQLKEIVEWYFDNSPICPYTVCQQQKPRVSRGFIEEWLCTSEAWNLLIPHIINLLKEIGVEIIPAVEVTPKKDGK